VASHRLKRTVRSALTASAVVAAAVSVAVSPAGADPSSPPPPPASTAPLPPGTPLQQYQALSQQASDLNEQYQNAVVDQQNKQNQLNAANADLAKAKQAEAAALAQENQFRSQVDQLTDASFEGAQFNQLSALLTGTSTQDFLDRATALSDMATDNTTALQKLAGAVNAANAAQQRATADQTKAQDATNAANALVAQIQQKKTALEAQVNQVKAAADKLSAADQAAIHNVGPILNIIAPPGIRGDAMNKALSKRGSTYVWGGAGPTTFDCSGLVMWSYAQFGVSLPHSSQAQSGMGTLISNRADLQPGDLVFFGSSGHIHHVGIYVGNGDMVDAPDTGSVVRIDPLFSDYAWGRRLGS
jgi:peptidoglycan DL-endopeptidase CwlO